MSNLIAPYGIDSLKPLVLPETERPEELRRAEGLTQLPMILRQQYSSVIVFDIKTGYASSKLEEPNILE